tara:strand:+ start:32 stop:1735 length:1704 start_codon:yes stop_codon:yes gene_type:complete
MRSQPIKKTLILGRFQAGKTSGQVKEAYARQQKDSNLVAVYAAYGQNTNKENQERHFREIYGKDLNLITSSEDLKAFKLQAQKNQLPKSKFTVISILGNHYQLEVLQNILATKSDFKYSIWLDESDTYSKDFDYQKVGTRKDNLIDSINKLKYHQVTEIVYVTATPFTELVQDTDFDEVIEVPAGEGYIGLDKIKDSMETISPEEIDAFAEGYLSEGLKDFLIEQNSVKNSVTIVSTNSKMSTHKIQCNAISDFLQDPDTLIVEFNSNQGQKYFSQENPYISKKKNRKDQLIEMFEVAEDYTKLIIVGHQTLDRSVTLKNSKYTSYSGMLFSSGRDVALSSLLQRLARITGYQSYTPQLLTDKGSKVILAENDYPIYVDLCTEHKKAVPRREAFLKLRKTDVNYPNALGNYRHNGYKDKGGLLTTPTAIYSEEEKEDYNYTLISNKLEIEDKELPQDVLEQLTNKEKAYKGTPLHKFITSSFPTAKHILEARASDGTSLVDRLLPNRENDRANYRDTLYLRRPGKLVLCNQPYGVWNTAFALHDIVKDKYRAYDRGSAYKRLEKNNS